MKTVRATVVAALPETAPTPLMEEFVALVRKHKDFPKVKQYKDGAYDVWYGPKDPLHIVDQGGTLYRYDFTLKWPLGKDAKTALKTLLKKLSTGAATAARKEKTYKPSQLNEKKLKAFKPGTSIDTEGLPGGDGAWSGSKDKRGRWVVFKGPGNMPDHIATDREFMGIISESRIAIVVEAAGKTTYEVSFVGKKLTFKSEKDLIKGLDKLGISKTGTYKNPKTRPELQGQPKFSGVLGPMYNGPGVVRYESQEQYNRMSSSIRARVVTAAEPAEQAFNHELKGYFAQELEKALKDIEKTMLAIQKGKFPDKRIEYAVMRYQPGGKGGAEFLKELTNHFLAWRSQLKADLK